MALLTSTASWQCHCHNIISLSPVCPALEGLIHLVVWFGAVGLADRPAANLLAIFSCELVEVVAFGGGGGGGGGEEEVYTSKWSQYEFNVYCSLV